MNTQATINQQIAGALGDAGGSYELLIGSHICDALGVEPTPIRARRRGPFRAEALTDRPTRRAERDGSRDRRARGGSGSVRS